MSNIPMNPKPCLNATIADHNAPVSILHTLNRWIITQSNMLFSCSLSHCWICCFWQLSLGLGIFFKLKPKSEHLEPTHCVCNSAQSTRRLLYVSIRHLWMVLLYHCVAMILSNNQKSHYPGEQDFTSQVSTSSPFKVKQIARVWFLKILHKVASRWCDP